MQTIEGVTLSDVQSIYNGAVGDVWELIMGEQIHIGGFKSSMDLAEKAGIGAGMAGVDLCCCNGAGMRFLARFRNVDKMMGVDATSTVVERGIDRCEKEGLSDKIDFVLADVTQSGLPNACADFVWGEDAWCYVVDKDRLITEAVRLVRPGGLIAFTDWIEGPTKMTTQEAQRFLDFMKFPNLQDLEGYKGLLVREGCEIVHAMDTGRFADYCDLYIGMVDKQLTYDVLKLIGFDMPTMTAMAGELLFIQKLAHEGKLAQGLFVARKKA
jgi:SAM-dependent methyltransferase